MGLSQVMSTLILLVSSTLMASGTVVYYSLTVRSAATHQEQLVVADACVWVNASGAQAALIIQNAGGVDASIKAVEIRYKEMPLEGVFYTQAIGYNLVPVEGLNITGSFIRTLGDAVLSFEKATGSITIPVGGEVVIYVDEPPAGIKDIGTIVSVVVQTNANIYMALAEVGIA